MIEVDLPPEGIFLPSHLKKIERAFVEKALERADGVKTKAAQFLGVNRTTLVEMMRRLGLPLLGPNGRIHPKPEAIQDANP